MSRVTSVRKRRPGPPLPANWKARYLEYLRTEGGFYRSARLVGVEYDTTLAERDRDPEFDKACHYARQERADLISAKMVKSAEESGNPAGFIVELKAIRPLEYIEKHAIMTVSANLAELPQDDARALLQAMLGSTTPQTQHMLTQGDANDP